jgi:hypothetical protein
MMKCIQMFDRFWAIFLGAILTVLLLGSIAQCSTPISPPKPFIEFENRKNLNFPIGAEEDATQNGIELYLSGIHGIDRDTAVAYGQTDVGATLLRTDDRGQHWQEKIIDSSGTAVRSVNFLNKNIGWALVEYFQGEAGGPITLYGTVDAGKTWKELSYVPTKTTYWELVNVQLFDEKRGQVDIFEFESYDRIYSWVTNDGGLTWKARAVIEGDKIKPYCKSYAFDIDKSTAFDGSFWQVYRDDSGDNSIVKQAPAGAKPTIASTIPISWRYQNGNILPKPPGPRRSRG